MFVLVILFSLSLVSNGLDCDYIQYDLENIRIQKPIGVCHSDFDIAVNDSSIKLTCKSDGTDVNWNYYTTQDCQGTPSKTISTTELMANLSVSPGEYMVKCDTGNGCQYAIERTYHLRSCLRNVKTTTSYTDSIHLIGGCSGAIDVKLNQYETCDNTNDLTGKTFLGASNCNGTHTGTIVVNDGSCTDGKQSAIICGTADISVC